MTTGSPKHDIRHDATAADQDAVAVLSRARSDVLERIAAACVRTGRDPAGVQLIAVSKTVPPDRLRAALEAGLDIFGENRVQEVLAKAAAVPGAVWHLIGPLQSNKARRAVEVVSMIQSVDTVDLAHRLDRLAGELRPGRPLPVLLQVNVDADLAKAGFAPDELDLVLSELLDLPNLVIRGLMTVGLLVGDAEAARPTFVGLRTLLDRLRRTHPALGPELSMGMSDDYVVAVEEGATMVRVGRALFGPRPIPPTGDR